MKIPATPSLIILLILFLVLVEAKADSRTGGLRERRRKQSSCNDYSDFQKCRRNRRRCQWSSLQNMCVDVVVDVVAADPIPNTNTNTNTAPAPASVSVQACPISNPNIPCAAVYKPLECRKGPEVCVYDNSCFAATAGYVATDCIPATTTTKTTPTTSEEEEQAKDDTRVLCPVEDSLHDVCSQEMAPVTCTGGCSYDNRCKAGAAGFIYTDCESSTNDIPLQLNPIGVGGGSIGGSVPQGAMEAPLFSDNPRNKEDPQRLPAKMMQTFCYYNSQGEDTCLLIEQGDNHFDCFDPQTPCPDSGKCVMDYSPECGPRVCKQIRSTPTQTKTITSLNPMKLCTNEKCRHATDCQDGYECVSWAHDCGIAV